MICLVEEEYGDVNMTQALPFWLLLDLIPQSKYINFISLHMGRQQNRTWCPMSQRTRQKSFKFVLLKYQNIVLWWTGNITFDLFYIHVMQPPFLSINSEGMILNRKLGKKKGQTMNDFYILLKLLAL